MRDNYIQSNQEEVKFDHRPLHEVLKDGSIPSNSPQTEPEYNYEPEEFDEYVEEVHQSPLVVQIRKPRSKFSLKDVPNIIVEHLSVEEVKVKHHPFKPGVSDYNSFDHLWS